MSSDNNPTSTLHAARQRIAELEASEGALRQAKKELEKATRQTAEILNNLNDGFFSLDEDTTVVFFNTAAERLLGRKAEEVLGRRLFDAFPEARGSIFEEKYTQAIREKEFINFETYFGAPPYTGWYDVRVHPMEEGILVYFLVTTERKEAEDELKKSQVRLAKALARLSFHVNNSPLAVIELEKGRTVRSWSSQAEAMFGWTAEEMLGKDWEELSFVVEEDIPYVTECVAELFEESTDHNVCHNKNYRKDGTVIHCAWYHSAMKDESGNVVSLFSLVADVTERMGMEMELVQAKELAETANRAKNEFLANMSHEIRTPLNGVLGMLQLLQETPLDAEQREYVDLAAASGSSLLTVIEDILDISKIEAGKVEIRKEAFRPGSLVQSIEAIFRNEALRKNILLRFNVDPHLPAVLMGDGGRIRQILFNLAGNALKFTHEGQVKIHLWQSLPESGDRVVLSMEVSDTGIGIPKDKLQTIFKPFIQADGSFTRKYGGTGLGLSIVKRLTELMQGTVQIESEEGSGTQIRCDIPVLHTSEAAKQAARTNKTLMSSPAEILVAEDDASNKMLIQHLLGKQGHAVVCVSNGREALEALTVQHFDLILMDVQMPEMDGIEATHLIRSGKSGVNSPDIPIIALTAHAMKGDREQFLLRGMTSYLSKPLVMEELITLLADFDS
jgi:PAS domain S-box-containing protein